MVFQALNNQVRLELLDERHEQLGGVEAGGLHRDQGNGNQGASGDLEAELSPRGQSQIAAVNHLCVVVGEPNRGKCAGGQYRNPDESVRQVGPQQRGDDDGNCNQQAAHGGCPRLFLMSLRAFLADVLADLELAQTIDDQRSDNQSREKGSKAGKGSAKSQITEDAERREVVEQL